MPSPSSPLSRLTILLLLSLLTAPLPAAITSEKSPGDVYRQAQRLADEVRKLRQRNHITTPWPRVAIEPGREPRHVFQKALEILGKINKYRVNVAGLGEITIPRFPGRDITPNEVYGVVVRLRQELALLTEETPPGRSYHPGEDAGSAQADGKKTPGHVYAALSEISIALEETLGLRSITPSEVYQRSQQVIELVRFLRRSQNLPMKVPKPERTRGKLPNHALKSVHKLLGKIRLAERNLWMKPVKQPATPRRVISPSDVYDAMGLAIAELERIQYRLGLEREFAMPEQEPGKTPDDVILNTEWAHALMPTFPLSKPLQQYDRSTLVKTPNEVYSVTEHVLQKLHEYRRLRGIRTPPRRARMIRGLKPQHVYAKALEIMEKIDLLRRQQGLGPMTVPSYPLRRITPSEVFDLASRLDSELVLIYRKSDLEAQPWGVETQVEEYENKQPSDVFFNMQRISNLLDTLIGSEGFTPNDVYREVVNTRREVMLIAEHIGEPIPERVWNAPPFKPETEPRNVLQAAREVLNLIVRMKRRAGMFGVRNIAIPAGEVVTPTDVYNQVRLIESELTEFKVFLGVGALPDPVAAQQGRTPAHVLQVLEGIDEALRIILHADRDDR